MYREATTGSEADNWKAAIKEELAAHQKNGTWTHEPLPEGKKTLSCSWVFKTKYTEDPNMNRYKARLCLRGFMQQPGIDYDEIFAPVVRTYSVRTLIAIAAMRD